MNSVSRQHNESGRARCIAFSLGRARLAERSANDKAFRDCRRPAECETAGSRLQSESGHARYAFSNVAVILSGRDSPRAPGILTRFVTEHDFLSHSFPGDGSLRPLASHVSRHSHVSISNLRTPSHVSISFPQKWHPPITVGSFIT